MWCVCMCVCVCVCVCETHRSRQPSARTSLIVLHRVKIEWFSDAARMVRVVFEWCYGVSIMFDWYETGGRMLHRVRLEYFENSVRTVLEKCWKSVRMASKWSLYDFRMVLKLCSNGVRMV
jgi:hypothetical protein